MKFNDLSLSTLVVQGVCQYWREITALVSIEENIYKCVTCGDEVEQYVNGVIKYLPTTKKGKKQLYGTKS
jgi:hypothetical protein